MAVESLDDSRRLANTGIGLLIKIDSDREASTQGRIQPARLGGRASSEIFGSQVS